MDGICIDHADLGFLRDGIHNVLEGDGDDPVVLDRDHGVRTPVPEEFHGRVSEISRVLDVIGAGRSAPHLVPYFLVVHGHFDAKGIQVGKQLLLEHVGEVDLRIANVPVVVVLNAVRGLEVLNPYLFDEPFRRDGHPVVSACRQPLDDGSRDNIHDKGQGNLPVGGKFFRDHDHRGSGTLSDPQGEMPCDPSHGHGDKPAARGFGVLHEVGDDLRSKGSCRLESERGNSFRQGKVVIYGLRHVGEADGQPEAVLRVVRYPEGGIGGIVTPDRHQVRHSEFYQGIDDSAQGFIALCGVESGCPENAASVRVDPADHVDGEGDDFFLSQGEVRESIVYPENLPSAFLCLDRHGTDDAVDSRGGPSSADYCKGILYKCGHYILLIFKISICGRFYHNPLGYNGVVFSNTGYIRTGKGSGAER